MAAQLITPLPCSKKILGLNPGVASFCMEFAFSPHVLQLPVNQSDLRVYFVLVVVCQISTTRFRNHIL